MKLCSFIGNLSEKEEVLHEVDSLVLDNLAVYQILTRLYEYDINTYMHSRQVAYLNVHIGQEEGFNSETLVKLGYGGLLHDLGKMLVPVHILKKPGTLSEDEIQIMQMHPTDGKCLARLCGVTDEAVLSIIAQHHERANGQGYPEGLSGNEISPLALITGVSDVFSALISTRCYREALPKSEVIKIMREDTKLSSCSKYIDYLSDLDYSSISYCSCCPLHRDTRTK